MRYIRGCGLDCASKCPWSQFSFITCDVLVGNGNSKQIRSQALMIITHKIRLLRPFHFIDHLLSIRKKCVFSTWLLNQIELYSILRMSIPKRLQRKWKSHTLECRSRLDYQHNASYNGNGLSRRTFQHPLCRTSGKLRVQLWIELAIDSHQVHAKFVPILSGLSGSIVALRARLECGGVPRISQDISLWLWPPSPLNLKKHKHIIAVLENLFQRVAPQQTEK